MVDQISSFLVKNCLVVVGRHGVCGVFKREAIRPFSFEFNFKILQAMH